MSSWSAAHRVAHMRAVRARDDLGVRAGHPVDVFSAIAAAGLTIMWKPMPRLLGGYLDDPDSDRGVLLNPDLSPSARRHTAAHELGHDRFGHGTRFDWDDDDHLDARPGGWPPIEREAEAFAAWFLMSPAVIRGAMTRLGLSTVASPAEVYQLSLRLGTPYRTTARHLGLARIVPVSRASGWINARPERLKSALDRAAPPPLTRSHDVWRVDAHADGEHLAVAPGDRVVVVDADVVRPDDSVKLRELARGRTSYGSRAIILEVPSGAGWSAQSIDVGASHSWRFSITVYPAPPSGLDPLTRD